MGDTDWSQLPYDLISTIANRLSLTEDFLAFSGVCRSWRSVYFNKNWTPGPQFPWLMLSEEKSCESTRAFFSFHKNNRLISTLPEAHGRRCWGSPWGWLITIGLDLEIYLLNPITRIRINLPPQATFRRLPDSEVIDNCECFRTRFIHKAFLFKKPCTSYQVENPFLVLAIHGPEFNLAFARPRYDSWVPIETSCPLVFRDVVLFQGKIFAICGEGTLHVVEINELSPPRAMELGSPPNVEWVWQQMYLVESSGDLLLLFRSLSHSVLDFSLETTSFEVYKFDFNAKEWAKLDDLGDRALFVGDNSSFSLSASDVANCKGNCIYFTDDKLEMWPICDDELPRCDMGVYNMGDRSIEPLNFGENFLLHYSAPVWVTPAIC